MADLVQNVRQVWDDPWGLLALDPARLTEPDMLARLVLQVLLLLGSAFFSGSETALTAAARARIAHLEREPGRTHLCPTDARKPFMSCWISRDG